MSARSVAAGAVGLLVAAVAAGAARADADCTPVPLWDRGRPQVPVCEERAEAAGLTVIDVSEGWRPAVTGDDAGTDELAARLSDRARRRCHDAVEDGPLARTRAVAYGGRGTAVRAVQAHLRCDGLLDARARRGVLDARTAQALRAYQRREALEPTGRLDPPTRSALLDGDRERDLRAALRLLRDRVAAAAGLLEDGSALGRTEPVLGRLLDPAERHTAPVPGGAPDLVDRATDAAARALGWTSADAVARFLAARRERVAVRLPPAPAYHASHMELRAELDSGAADRPARAADRLRPRPAPTARRPTLTLWARDRAGTRVALVRWPVSARGWWHPRLARGRVGLRWGARAPVPRVWRDLLIGGGGDAVTLVHHEGEGDALVAAGVLTHAASPRHPLRAGGCHDLAAPQAARLAAFLLQHRLYLPHVATAGAIRYELVPPVPVDAPAGAGGARSGITERHANARPRPAARLARAAAL